VSSEQASAEEQVLLKTSAILAGESDIPPARVIRDAAALSQSSQDPEVAYCAIALAALDNGVNATSYAYPLASMFFRDPDGIIQLLQRLPEESRPVVVGIIVEGAQSVSGDPSQKARFLDMLGR